VLHGWGGAEGGALGSMVLLRCGKNLLRDGFSSGVCLRNPQQPRPKPSLCPHKSPHPAKPPVPRQTPHPAPPDEGKELARVGAGQCFGELALLNSGARAANVMALEDSKTGLCCLLPGCCSTSSCWTGRFLLCCPIA
jgi:hypothetical protein